MCQLYRWEESLSLDIKGHQVIVDKIIKIVLEVINDPIRIEVSSKPDLAGEITSEQIATPRCNGGVTVIVMCVVDHNAEGLRVNAEVIGEGYVHRGLQYRSGICESILLGTSTSRGLARGLTRGLQALQTPRFRSACISRVLSLQ